MSRKQRLSASVDADLVEAAHAAVAGGRAENLSAWVNEALRRQVDHDRRMQALDEFSPPTRLSMARSPALASTGSSDVIDAAVVLLASDGDEILTTA